MRIHHVSIDGFKNLNRFSVALDEKCLTTVILGQNATGKSNLLEALVLIFRNLDLGEPSPFKYEIEYECRRKLVHIVTNKPADLASTTVTVDGQPIAISAFVKDPDRQYLPNNVFGYYSGPSSRFESHFARHQEKFYRQLLDDRDDEAIRPLFYARLIHSQFVLLAFFYAREEQKTAKFLREYLQIEDLESVLFVLKQPPWTSPQGDKRFWNSRGVVQKFLDQLYTQALAPMRLRERVNLDLTKSTMQERLYLYLRDRQTLRQLRAEYATSAEFFKALESTYLSKLLAEVRIRVRIRGCSDSLTFRELSEGEQQLLTVLGLLRFTRDKEALFLLDEPDTHLNPVWSLHYLELLKQVVGDDTSSHIIMTTHDPLTIAGLTKDEVRVMWREEDSCEIRAMIPEHDPKGMGVSGILTSELFGLRSDLDLETLKLLDEKRALSAKKELSGRDKKRLAQLRNSLQSLDLSSRVRDPLYRQFVKALTADEEFKETRETTLTPEQQKRRTELASKSLRKVKAEMRKGSKA